jgi:hypothetical protein
VKHELQLAAIDDCNGDVTSSLRISGVTSSTGSGVISFSDDQVCLIADREGTADDTTYTITTVATDGSGLIGTSPIFVTIPHDKRSGKCLQQSKIARSFE